MEEDDIPQFAARLKTKFPEYADVEDTELVERVVRKHPVYASQVKLPSDFKLLRNTTGYPKLDAIYEQAGRDNNVDPELLVEQGRQETINFKPDVMYGRQNSPAGAQGAGQFMAGTAPKYGVIDRTDPIQSINGQAKYMRKLLDQFDNNEELALAGYNSGEYRQSLRNGQVPKIPETQKYVKIIGDGLAKIRSQGLTLKGVEPQPQANPSNPLGYNGKPMLSPADVQQAQVQQPIAPPVVPQTDDNEALRNEPPQTQEEVDKEFQAYLAKNNLQPTQETVDAFNADLHKRAEAYNGAMNRLGQGVNDLSTIGRAAKSGLKVGDYKKQQAQVDADYKTFAEKNKLDPKDDKTVELFNTLSDVDIAQQNEASKDAWLAKNPKLVEFATKNNLDPTDDATIGKYNAQLPKGTAPAKSQASQPKDEPFDEVQFNAANLALTGEGKPAMTREQYQAAVKSFKGSADAASYGLQDVVNDKGEKVRSLQQETPQPINATEEDYRQWLKDGGKENTAENKDAFRQDFMMKGAVATVPVDLKNAPDNESVGKWSLRQALLNSVAPQLGASAKDVDNYLATRSAFSKKFDDWTKADVENVRKQTGESGVIDYTVTNELARDFTKFVKGDTKAFDDDLRQKSAQLQFQGRQTPDLSLNAPKEQILTPEEEAAAREQGKIANATKGNLGATQARIGYGFLETGANVLASIARLTGVYDETDADASNTESKAKMLDKYAEKMRIVGESASGNSTVWKLAGEGARMAGDLPYFLVMTAVPETLGASPFVSNIIGFTAHSALTSTGKPIKDQIAGLGTSALLAGTLGVGNRFAKWAGDKVADRYLTPAIAKLTASDAEVGALRDKAIKVFEVLQDTRAPIGERNAAKNRLNYLLRDTGLTAETFSKDALSSDAAMKEVLRKADVIRNWTTNGIKLGVVPAIGAGMTKLQGGSNEEAARSFVLFAGMEVFGTMFGKKSGERLTDSELDKANGTLLRLPDGKGGERDVVFTRKGENLEATDVTGKAPDEAIQAQGFSKNSPTLDAPTDKLSPKLTDAEKAELTKPVKEVENVSPEAKSETQVEKPSETPKPSPRVASAKKVALEKWLASDSPETQADGETQKVEAKGDNVVQESGAIPKTRLDGLLDKVTPQHEVTIDIQGDISSEQVKRVTKAATDRGLDAAFDGHRFLVRKITAEAPAPVEKPEAKEPWQMTNLEYSKNQLRQNKNLTKRDLADKITTFQPAFAGQHKVEIKAALERGEKVPPEVLADYPDLAKTPAQPPRKLAEAKGAKVDVAKTQQQALGTLRKLIAMPNREVYRKTTLYGELGRIVRDLRDNNGLTPQIIQKIADSKMYDDAALGKLLPEHINKAKILESAIRPIGSERNRVIKSIIATKKDQIRGWEIFNIINKEKIAKHEGLVNQYYDIAQPLQELVKAGVLRVVPDSDFSTPRQFLPSGYAGGETSNLKRIKADKNDPIGLLYEVNPEYQKPETKVITPKSTEPTQSEVKADQKTTTESAGVIAVPRSAVKKYSYADEVADQIGTDTFKAAEKRSQMEKPSSRTGFTKTQTEYLVQKIKEFGDQHPTEWTSDEEPNLKETIAVPDDGVLRLQLGGAQRLYKMLTGKRLREDLVDNSKGTVPSGGMNTRTIGKRPTIGGELNAKERAALEADQKQLEQFHKEGHESEDVYYADALNSTPTEARRNRLIDAKLQKDPRIAKAKNTLEKVIKQENKHNALPNRFNDANYEKGKSLATERVQAQDNLKAITNEVRRELLDGFVDAKPTDTPLKSVPQGNALDSVYNEKGVDYDKAKDVAGRIERGELEISRLDPSGEQGRREGGQRNVEASLVLGASEAKYNETPRGSESRVDVQRRQERVLERYARETGNWIDPKRFPNRYRRVGAGAEAVVYHQDGDPNVYKVIDYRQINKGTTPQEFLDRISLFNTLFPEAPYTLEGITREDGKLKFVIKQPYVNGGGVPEKQFIQAMENRGWTHIGGESYENSLYQVHDLHGKNAMQDADGNIYVIDAVPQLKDEHYRPFNVVAKDSALRSVPQARQTDTKAFKDWFKDSAVVDDKGEPLVVYHGTGADFDAFQKTGGRYGSGNSAGGLGYWFTDNTDVANTFAEFSIGNQNIVPTYLSLKNPKIYGELSLDELEQRKYDADTITTRLRAIADRLKEVNKESNEIPWQERYEDGFKGTERVQKLKKEYEDLNNEERRIRNERSALEGNDPYEQLMADRDEFVERSQEPPRVRGTFRGHMMEKNTAEANEAFVKKLRDEGYDGIIVKQTSYDAQSAKNKVADQYIAFKPTQIKSAIGNSGEFDPNNPSILKHTPDSTLSPEEYAQLEGYKAKHLGETIPDMESSVKGQVIHPNLPTVEVMRTLLSHVEGNEREDAVLLEGTFLPPSVVNDVIDTAHGLAEAMQEKGLDDKPLQQLIKNLEIANKEGEGVVFREIPHEVGHAASFKGPKNKAIAVRYYNPQELKQNTLFRTVFKKWTGIEGKDWDVDTADDAQLGHAAEEALMYIASNQAGRLGLSPDEGDTLAVDLGLRYAQGRINENPNLTVRDALKTFDNTIVGKYTEKVDEYEKNRIAKQGNTGDVESAGTGREKHSRDNTADEEADADGVQKGEVGERKESKLGKDIREQAFADGITSDWGDTAQYSPKTMAEQAERANALIDKDRARAMRIIQGEEPPTGLHPESVYTALRIKARAEGDVQTLRELANATVASEASILGQRIKMLDTRESTDPVKLIREVQQVREKEAKTRTKQTVKDVVNDIKKEKVTLKPRDWTSFIESLRC